MSDIKYKTYPISGGYKINIASVGEGPVVVCIHGSGPGASGLSNFRGNYQAIVDAGYTVLMPDLIGYGNSSQPEGIDYPLEFFASTLFEALQAHGVSQAHLVGNSLGGGISLQLALDHPEFVKSLVLLAPGSIEELETYMAMPGIRVMGEVFMAPEYTFESQKKILLNLVHPDFAPNVPDSLIRERFEVAKSQPKDVLFRMKTPNLQPRLKELSLPILVYWGKDDIFLPYTGANHFLENCPQARTVTFTRTGHWVQVERAREFNAYTVSFLEGQD
ncbi:alpha/beta fold hydrolase [Henriciella litoralis]|uniref:alpha/beta fold hydrolase n=1 Tax=Henriciella litoralis TaxID=568102 RepID=UPI000A068E35|nr:alpha/beta hydrolase [Henriciella litoralis]